MINDIGSVQKAQLSLPTFKSDSIDKKTITNPINHNVSALELLANYNKNFIEKLNIKPSSLIIKANELDKVNGEEIYTSDGYLHSVIDNTDDYKTIYKFNHGENATLESVHRYDSKTNKLLTKQDGYDVVYEYNPINGKIISLTEYENSEPTFIVIYKNKNGIESEICKDLKINKYYTYETNTETGESLDVSFDKNKKIQELRANKSNGLSSEFFNIDFYDGSIISATKKVNKIFPNTSGRESMNLENLKPHQNFTISASELSSFKGNKTYYSNGSLESNTIDLIYDNKDIKMTCYFEPDGRLSKINTENKEIVFSDNHQNISEFLADGSLKTTKYFQDSCIVSIESPSSERKVWYDKNGNVNSYHDDEKSLYFNELGMLTDYLLKIKD